MKAFMTLTHALEVIEIEGIKEESDASVEVNGIAPQARDTSDSEMSVAELLKLVKGDAEKYIPKMNPDIRYSLDGEITDADILQMLVDEGVLQTMEPGIEPALSAIGALADKTPGTNTDPNDVQSGQRIISDMMGAMGLTADARHVRYDLHLRKGTAGYTMQDRIAHIQDAQNVVTAAHELGSFI